eukprot:g1421.t1
MAEYDPRPSRSRREHTLDKLRKALPWPEDDQQVAGGVDGGGDEGYGSGTRDSVHHTGEGEEARGERGRPDDDVSVNGCYVDDVAGDDQLDSNPGAERGEGGEQPPSRAGRRKDESNGANAVADRAGAGGRRGVVDHPTSGSNGDSDDGGSSSAFGESDARGPLAGSRSVDNTEEHVDGGGGGGGDVAGEGHPGSPRKPRIAPVGDGDDDGKIHAVTPKAKANDDLGAREDRGQAGVAAANGPTKRPATGQRKKPTLPDPNEVNGSVMADPFNMDHIKDLPGLIGGDSRGFSSLVRDTVSYIDPAFPNLEFHRRAVMDRAGYFMPGYKPQGENGRTSASDQQQQRRRGKKKTSPPPSTSSTTPSSPSTRQHRHRIGVDAFRG